MPRASIPTRLVLDAPSAATRDTRQRILDYLRERPGVSMSQISRELDLHWPIVSYHLKRLEDAGLAATGRHGRRRIVWSTEVVDPTRAPERRLLDEPSCLRVAHAIVVHPGLTVGRLAARAGLSTRMVYHHSSRLIEGGLVEAVPRGRYRELKPAPRLLMILGLLD